MKKAAFNNFFENWKYGFVYLSIFLRPVPIIKEECLFNNKKQITITKKN